MTADLKQNLSSAEAAFAYHARTKHRLERYAAGPETLDWDAQPNPFREFAGAARTSLALAADPPDTSIAEIYTSGSVAPRPLTIDSAGALLEFSMGLSAWKEYGPDRWALRCNPSSGNLHPTEAYLISRGIPGLDDGVYHYVSRDHVLEHRCPLATKTAPAQLWVGLSSVHWREAWKYGERAFRYCQLDIGHAVAAIRYAAAILGWRAKVVEHLDSAELAALMGLDRVEDFAGAEREDADLLIAIESDPTQHQAGEWNPPPVPDKSAGEWSGRANVLDPHPMYHWPVIEQVSSATQTHGTRGEHVASDDPPLTHGSDSRAAEIIRGRRSAQRFDSKFAMSSAVFYRLLDCLLARPHAPFDVWTFAPRLHPVLFVHRVEGLEPGLYAMPRSPAAERQLREELREDAEWRTPEGTPPHLPLKRLVLADCRAPARTMSCHQWIASDSCFAMSMLSEFDPIIAADPWRYRQLHWEAGLLGHVLYLEAEAAGLRGTGIGCYFDDALHELVGITSTNFQALYHFTVGRPLTDTRISTLPAYPGRRSHQLEG